MHTNITLCLTIGMRPVLLRQTLVSLFAQAQFSHVIAINDFGDEATNLVFKELCPRGTLISQGHQGHHLAVDTMYKQVQTPYILHCEDDWLFNDDLMLSEAIALLEKPEISMVCFRKIADFSFDEWSLKRVREETFQNMPYVRLDALHQQWHGYTFNPHLAKRSLWQSAGEFSRFKKERHVSRWVRQQGKFAAFIQPGACVHIGEALSIANPELQAHQSFFKRIRRMFKNWLRQYI